MERYNQGHAPHTGMVGAVFHYAQVSVSRKLNPLWVLGARWLKRWTCPQGPHPPRLYLLRRRFLSTTDTRHALLVCYRDADGVSHFQHLRHLPPLGMHALSYASVTGDPCHRAHPRYCTSMHHPVP